MAKRKTRSERKELRARAGRASQHGLPPPRLEERRHPPLGASPPQGAALGQGAKRSGRSLRAGEESLPGGKVPTIVKIGLAAGLALVVVFALAQLRQNKVLDATTTQPR